MLVALMLNGEWDFIPPLVRVGWVASNPHHRESQQWEAPPGEVADQRGQQYHCLNRSYEEVMKHKSKVHT